MVADLLKHTLPVVLAILVSGVTLERVEVVEVITERQAEKQ